MRPSTIITLLFLLTGSVACTQPVAGGLKYLGQEPPTLQPAVFAPGLISLEGEYEFGSVFNKDATAFYYAVDIGGKAVIRYSELHGNEWTRPVNILSHDAYGYNDPFLSPDEQRLYFISRKATVGSGAKEDYDIWYVEKQGDTWSAPVNAGPNINSAADEYYISFTRNGTMYFASDKNDRGVKTGDHDIYRSEFTGGAFQPATKLGDAINTPAYEADVFVAPDESYLIFCARRPGGFGRGDLYVSFRNDAGTWAPAVNMGDKINTVGHELCPFVSADGKYLFYTSNKDIYWVDAGILEGLRH